MTEHIGLNIELGEQTPKQIFIVKYKGNNGRWYYTYPATYESIAEKFVKCIQERDREVLIYELKSSKLVTKDIPKVKFKKIKKVKQ